MNKFILIVVCFLFTYQNSIAGELPPIPDPEPRSLKEIEEEIEKLKSSIEVMEQ